MRHPVPEEEPAPQVLHRAVLGQSVEAHRQQLSCFERIALQRSSRLDPSAPLIGPF
jgi:hypothetical protein